ncbi:hypothetical protein LTR49_000990 [Elasticomyces elasticus]|nr:hypothetical protein LTR49_000990 [Elasticomyces elasticus]KAK5769588.1 hypothetical protein LTS12_000038 [Elasticomyces elasticus]
MAFSPRLSKYRRPAVQTYARRIIRITAGFCADQYPLQTTTPPPVTVSAVSSYTTTAIVTYTSVQPAYTSYVTGTTTLQITTSQISTQPASTATVTQYTTLSPNTVTRFVFHELWNVSSGCLGLSIITAVLCSSVRSSSGPRKPFGLAVGLLLLLILTISFCITPAGAAAAGAAASTSTQGSTVATSTSSVRASTAPPIITTTTTTTTAAPRTTSSSSFIRPAVALRSPTVIAGNTVSVTSQVDDAVYTVTIPFALTVYGVASSTIQISSNGVLGLSAVTSDYANAALPQYTINSVGVFPCWDDLLIFQSTPQGIFYSVDGTAPARSITFEWYTSHYQNATYYYHFLVSFWENLPNVTTFDYLASLPILIACGGQEQPLIHNMTDGGISALAGIEAQGPGKYSQYTNNQAILTNGKIISFNNSQNLFTSGYPPGITAIPGAIYY